MRNNRGFVAIILFFLIVAVALAVMPIIMQNASYHAVNEFVKAFYIAESGGRFYAKDIASDTDFSDNVGLTRNFGGGTFTITVVGPTPRESDRIIIRSTGRMSLGATTFNRIIEETLTNKIAAFEYVIYGEGDTSVDHNGTINGDTYVNGSVTIEHNLFGVNGTIYQSQTDADIPSVDWSWWESHATQVITPPGGVGSDYSFSGNTYNGIIYIKGNAIINKNNMSGSGTVIATGDISISGNSSNFTAGSNLGYPSFIAGNNFSANNVNQISVTGAIYAGNNLDIRIIAATGGVINGSLIYGNTCIIDQANNVTLNKDPNASSAGFTGGQKKMVLSGFKEI